MADSVDVEVIQSDSYFHIVRLTGRSDGTGENAVTKVDKSTLTASDGNEPKALDLCYANWDVSGVAVELLWDASTDDRIDVFQGTGERDYQKESGPLRDPISAGHVGDVLLTTVGSVATAGDSYSILLKFKLRART